MNKLVDPRTLFDRLIYIGINISGILLFVSWAIVLSEIFSRYALGFPLVWSVEVVEYMTLYSFFAGAVVVLKEEKHIKIDILLSRLNSKHKAWLVSINSVFGILVCFVLVWYGTEATIHFYEDGICTFTAMELPQWPFMMAIPLGSLMLLIQFVRRLIDNLTLAKKSKG